MTERKRTHENANATQTHTRKRKRNAVRTLRHDATRQNDALGPGRHLWRFASRALGMLRGWFCWLPYVATVTWPHMATSAPKVGPGVFRKYAESLTCPMAPLAPAKKQGDRAHDLGVRMSTWRARFGVGTPRALTHAGVRAHATMCPNEWGQWGHPLRDLFTLIYICLSLARFRRPPGWPQGWPQGAAGLGPWRAQCAQEDQKCRR